MIEAPVRVDVGGSGATPKCIVTECDGWGNRADSGRCYWHTKIYDGLIVSALRPYGVKSPRRFEVA
jgi:hypothetical protein